MFFFSFKFSVRIWIAVFQSLNRQPEIIAWSKFYFVPNLFDVLKQNVLRLIARTNRQQIIGILIYCVDCWRKNNIATIKETILSYWWMTKYSYGQQYIHLVHYKKEKRSLEHVACRCFHCAQHFSYDLFDFMLLFDMTSITRLNETCKISICKQRVIYFPAKHFK